MGGCVPISYILSLHSRPPIYTPMNTNLINLKPNEWSKQDWNDAYKQYCETEISGPKTKRQYYDFVLERHKRLEETHKPTPPELLQKWSAGRRAAAEWAKRHGCDLNGRLLTKVHAGHRDITTREIAERAEDIACASMQKLDIILQRMHRK